MTSDTDSQRRFWQISALNDTKYVYIVWIIFNCCWNNADIHTWIRPLTDVTATTILYIYIYRPMDTFFQYKRSSWNFHRIVSAVDEEHTWTIIVQWPEANMYVYVCVFLPVLQNITTGWVYLFCYRFTANPSIDDLEPTIIIVGRISMDNIRLTLSNITSRGSHHLASSQQVWGGSRGGWRRLLDRNWSQ